MSTITQQVCCVIPPHIIRHAAEHSDGATRRRLVATEAATRKLAAARRETKLLAAARHTPITPKRRIVYHAGADLWIHDTRWCGFFVLELIGRPSLSLL